ncbi:MAG: hypothetical protein ABEJ62_00240 [Candidatus Nanohaloarchaea archaeon]
MSLVRYLARAEQNFGTDTEAYLSAARSAVSEARWEYGPGTEEVLRQDLDLRNGEEPDFDSAYQTLRNAGAQPRTDQPIMEKR